MATAIKPPYSRRFLHQYHRKATDAEARGLTGSSPRLPLCSPPLQPLPATPSRHSNCLIYQQTDQQLGDKAMNHKNTAFSPYDAASQAVQAHISCQDSKYIIHPRVRKIKKSLVALQAGTLWILVTQNDFH